MLERYLLRAVEIPPSAKKCLFSVNSRIVITDDGKGIGSALVTKLQNRGYQAGLVTQVPPAADVVILLEGLRHFTDIDSAIAVNQQAFVNARIIAERFTHKGGTFISVQDTGGSFGLSTTHPLQTWAAGLSGLTKTAAQEWSKAHCRAVDLQQAGQTVEQLAERLFHEILVDSTELEIGLLNNGKRIAMQTLAASLQPKTIALKKKSIVVVTGGARGITAKCLIALAKEIPLRFVLLGRTSLIAELDEYKAYVTEAALKQALLESYHAKQMAITPKQIQQEINKILANREAQATCQTLEKLGSEVRYYAIDAADTTQLTTALNDVRKQWGKISGIVHGAGVLADKGLAQKTDEQFAQVFNTKVLGLKNLLQATKSDPLKLIALFSSVAARYGNIGQGDYAMANEVLNKIAQHEQQQRGKNCLVKSFNWGPWEGGMVTPQLKTLFEQRGITLLPVEQGTRAFVDELGEDRPQTVEVVYGGPLQSSVAQPTTLTKKFSVTPQSHPFLTSHVIEGVPVLPACLVLEWFMQTVSEAYPAAMITSCCDFKVLRGIRMTDFATVRQDFVVHCENKHSQLYLKLQHTNGTLHYAATMTLETHDNKKTNLVRNPSAAHQQSWPWQLTEIYNPAHLFHGPDFQAITALDTISGLGGKGELIGILQKNWPNARWQIDVLALDGALQLLRLWGLYQIGQSSLPTAIAEFHCYDKQLPTQPLQCFFKSTIKGKYRTLSDVVLLKKDGQLYAELLGVEMCVVPEKT